MSQKLIQIIENDPEHARLLEQAFLPYTGPSIRMGRHTTCEPRCVLVSESRHHAGMQATVLDVGLNNGHLCVRWLDQEIPAIKLRGLWRGPLHLIGEDSPAARHSRLDP